MSRLQSGQVPMGVFTRERVLKPPIPRVGPVSAACRSQWGCGSASHLSSPSPSKSPMNLRATGYEQVHPQPEWVVEVASLVTHLGDYLVVACIAVLFWLAVDRPRGRGPVVPIVVLAAIGLVTILKALFGLPRPPGATVGGYGFPSGHAVAATVTYGLIALRLYRGPLWARLGGATIAVLVVAASRVIIGVHYPADVLAGTALGVAILLSVLSRHQQDRGASPMKQAEDGLLSGDERVAKRRQRSDRSDP